MSQTYPDPLYPMPSTNIDNTPNYGLAVYGGIPQEIRQNFWTIDQIIANAAFNEEGTGGQIAWYSETGTTVSGDPSLDDGLTNTGVLTYTGNGGIAASSISLSNVSTGLTVAGQSEFNGQVNCYATTELYDQTSLITNETGELADSPTLEFTGLYESSSSPLTYSFDTWTIYNNVGAGLNGTSSLIINHNAGTTGLATVVFQQPIVVAHATPSGSLTGVAFGDTTGVGNGSSTNLTALAKSTGSGPASDAAAGWLQINVGGTVAWIPYFE
jgi:hypothetical protein